MKQDDKLMMLWTIIEDLDVWMHVEGCFISDRTKFKIDVARKLMNFTKEETDAKRELLVKLYEQEKKTERRRGK